MIKIDLLSDYFIVKVLQYICDRVNNVHNIFRIKVLLSPHFCELLDGRTKDCEESEEDMCEGVRP